MFKKWDYFCLQLQLSERKKLDQIGAIFLRYLDFLNWIGKICNSLLYRFRTGSVLLYLTMHSCYRPIESLICTWTPYLSFVNTLPITIPSTMQRRTKLILTTNSTKYKHNLEIQKNVENKIA